jgi:glycerol-3-phosphate O-acyltransferase
MRRLFAGIEVSGLGKVADYAKRHPLVLVPSHRSYFDFIILSVLFYDNHLVPPHIAARENMAFGPFGFIWRRCGAYFLRRSFDDPLYKRVFAAYVAYLIREGFTQEFFIEGGRSRTGKTLAPRMGMLAWNVEAFLDSQRRDLFFVPIAITYERLVEEGAMVGELEGAEKQKESMIGLMRARKFLQRRFGSVFVNFGEPISLAEAIGAHRELFSGDAPEALAARRAFIDRLGHRIVERINWAVVANATSVAATALLGERRRGMLRPELVRRMQEVADLLRLQDVRFTPALERDEGDFGESIASLLRMDLIRSVSDARGEILYFEESKRRALEIYRNSIAHFLVSPSFLARRLLSRTSESELREDLGAWLDLFYHEFFTPRAEVLAVQVDAFLDHFERLGYVGRGDGHLQATEKGLPYLRFLSEQMRGLVEAYYATFAAVLAAELPVDGKALASAAGEQFEHGQLLGEVDRREAANPVTFANAIDLLVRRGILEREEREEGRGSERVYTRGPAFDDLAALHGRLAVTLRAR